MCAFPASEKKKKNSLKVRYIFSVMGEFLTGLHFLLSLSPAARAPFRLSTEFKRHSRLRERLHAPCVASPLPRAH